MAVKPSRNEMCACGSGRKFKHCHGGLASTAASVQTVRPQLIGALATLLNQDRPAEAESQAWEALKRHPNAGLLWKILGVAQAHQRKDALQALRRAAELMPADAEALRNLGAALHDRAMWDEALPSLQAALALEPDHPAALVDAADALRALGRVRESVPLYQKVLSTNAQDVEALNNLGNAYLELGDHQRALECYERARRLRPMDAQISTNVGQALMLLGRLEEAESLARRAVTLDPQLAVAHNNLGLALAAQSKRTEAADSYREALRLKPDFIEALNNLGNALRELGDRRAALPLYRRAVELDPRSAENHCNLGNVLFEVRRVREAASCFRQAILLRPDYAPAHLSLAFALRQRRQPAEARQSCEAALKIDPNYVEAIVFMGELHADSGQFDEAEKLFRRAIELNPRYAHAFASIATHRRMQLADASWLHGAVSLLATPQPLAQEINLRYALGKYFDDVGQYEDAFGQYHKANELTKRFGVRYDRAGLTARVDRLMAGFDAQLWEKAAADASPSQAPVFIVGMPRSGTSLAEQILASHPQVYGCGEVGFWNAAYENWRDAEKQGGQPLQLVPAMARTYLERMNSAAGGAARIIDKMPANFMYAGLIHAVFPNARFIHMQRHPFDTALSIYFQNFFNIGPWANDFEDMAHYYGEYVRITRHWRAVLPARNWMVVPYEELIADQEGWSRRMLEFLGLPWDERVLEFEKTERVVITASKWQVRQKINSRSAGRWQHYERHLGALRELPQLVRD
ncbi:MAG: tetratricopeptide repeat protein [Proteobacteria bacterium]|nr:tetratricopeptide repeat protein [Pseudomonadota bacterium]